MSVARVQYVARVMKPIKADRGLGKRQTYAFGDAERGSAQIRVHAAARCGFEGPSDVD